jgi:undecaprenyl-diphosphatase
MRRRPELRIHQAAILGALHGPAELLPVSSSGHTTLVPWLAGWRYEELDADMRKAFEVALHAGTAAALLVALRSEVREALGDLNRRRAQLVVLSFLPPALAALALERQIERRLGTPATIAAGLLAGSTAMALADRTDQRRTRDEAGALDALCLGLAQACALVPGVSRNGATLVAARLRGFTREDANELSRHVALPLITGAAALKGFRVATRGLPSGARGVFGIGTGAAFLSTLFSTWLIRQVERDRSLMPYAAYRAGLAVVVIRRLRENRLG